MIMTVQTHAKVNLHLAVGSPQPDGFHPIQSLFARLALADELEVQAQRGPFSITVDGLGEYCKAGEDTISRTALLWYEATGSETELKVRVRKQIPVQSGLGGGSSDAAAMLHLLNGIAPLDEASLARIAQTVGSDVPFFFSQANAAIVEGRGELIKPIEARSLPILLVMPRSLNVSTKAAYAHLDEVRAKPRPFLPDTDKIVAVYNKSCATWCNMLYNDFYVTVAGLHFYDELQRLSEQLEGYATITGSGSCWFFVSEDETCIEKMREQAVECFGADAHYWQTTLLGSSSA